MWFLRLCLVLLLWLPLQTMAGERIALVLGIQQYQFHTSLPKASIDAKLMYDALVAGGIRVINAEHMVNLDIDHLNYWFKELVREAKTADEVYIYFAGHGLQHNNAVYLLATNSPNYDGNTPTSSLLLDTWLEKIAEANPSAQRVIWLDACRDNPLNYYNYVSPSYFGVSLKKTGNLIVYATAKGSKVKDDNPFAEEIAALLKQFPQTDIANLANDTVALIKAKTKGKQLVEVNNTLGRSVCLAGCKKVTSKPFRVLPQGCIKGTCINTPLVLSTEAITQSDLKQMLANKPKTFSSDELGGCWDYQDKNFVLDTNQRWNTLGTDKAQCLSKNDSEAYAKWYTLTQADGYYYALPSLEESAYIAALYQVEDEKERLEKCGRLGDNAPCYSHPQLGVYLVRK
ncbi:MAG: caspase family protein [Thiofilum sp.]|uniref:caspase family protein n=1 Tax=Thiofilum sp. TaxID=2212733 RepID=UPI0025F75DE0|nr:caspase family protein [Thiofilum sp.]MBK8452988.1 caspase family protein [Thiofilum sp.]